MPAGSQLAIRGKTHTCPACLLARSQATFALRRSKSCRLRVISGPCSGLCVSRRWEILHPSLQLSGYWLPLSSSHTRDTSGSRAAACASPHMSASQCSIFQSHMHAMATVHTAICASLLFRYDASAVHPLGTAGSPQQTKGSPRDKGIARLRALSAHDEGQVVMH